MVIRFRKLTLRKLNGRFGRSCLPFVLVTLVVLTHSELRADYLVLTSGERIT